MTIATARREYKQKQTEKATPSEHRNFNPYFFTCEEMSSDELPPSELGTKE